MPGQSLWVTLLFLFKALLAVPMGSAVPNWGQTDVHSSGSGCGEGFCLGDFGDLFGSLMLSTHAVGLRPALRGRGALAPARGSLAEGLS